MKHFLIIDIEAIVCYKIEYLWNSKLFLNWNYVISYNCSTLKPFFCQINNSVCKSIKKIADNLNSLTLLVMRSSVSVFLSINQINGNLRGFVPFFFLLSCSRNMVVKEFWIFKFQTFPWKPNSFIPMVYLTIRSYEHFNLVSLNMKKYS